MEKVIFALLIIVGCTTAPAVRSIAPVVEAIDQHLKKTGPDPVLTLCRGTLYESGRQIDALNRENAALLADLSDLQDRLASEASDAGSFRGIQFSLWVAGALAVLALLLYAYLNFKWRALKAVL